MSRPGPPSTTDALPAWQAISLSLLLVLAGNGLLLIFDAPGVLEDGLPTRFWDPDSYARLLRVEQWLRDEGWYATPLRSLNAPYGLVMHWTLPLDLLIAALAVPLRPLFGGAQALHTAGMLVGPLLAWSALALLLKHGSRLVGRRAALFAALLLAVQPATGSRFALGQADHHHLMMVLHLFVLLAVARAACDGHARRWSLAAGVAAGLMLWVSPPALVTLTAAALALGLLWACGWLAVAPLTRFAAGLAATVAAALALERPPAQWVVLEYDRLSAAHLWLALALLAGSALVAGAAHWIAPRTVAARLTLAALLATAVLGVLLAALPDLLGSPLALSEPRLDAVFRSRVRELQSAWPVTPADAGWLALEFAPALVALGWVGWAWRRAAPARRRLLLVYACFLLVALPYALAMRRGLELLVPSAALAWGEALSALLFATGGAWRARRRWRTAALALPALAVAAASGVSSYALAAAGVFQITAPPGLCSFRELGPWITAHTRPDRTVLTDLNAGPEIAWHSARGVPAGFYHRNLAGLRDVSAMFFSRPGDAAARALAETRRIDTVALCRQLMPADVDTVRGQPQILFTRLMRGRPPPWLQPVPLPARLQSRFWLYRVR